jgi:hypothetical protein
MMFYARLKIYVMSIFHWCAESPDNPEIFPEIPDFSDIPGSPRTVRTYSLRFLSLP